MTQKLFDLNKLIQISLDEIIDAMFWCHHFFRWPRTYLCFTVWTLTQPSKCSSQLSGSLYVNFSELWWNHWKAGNNFLENQWWQDMKQISLMPRQGYKILISTLHICFVSTLGAQMRWPASQARDHLPDLVHCISCQGCDAGCGAREATQGFPGKVARCTGGLCLTRHCVTISMNYPSMMKWLHRVINMYEIWQVLDVSSLRSYPKFKFS